MNRKALLIVAVASLCLPAIDHAAESGISGSQQPSFDCSKVNPESIEALICIDPELATLDRKLADVYAAASKKAANEHPPQLKATQRGWIKGRDECWKSDDRKECVRTEYTHRIAELQAQYRLVAARGPVSYVCDGNPAKEVVVSYFETEPPTAIAEFGDSTSMMYVQSSGSGTRYQGRNETLWEHQNEAMIRWGYDAPQMLCKTQP